MQECILRETFAVLIKMLWFVYNIFSFSSVKFNGNDLENGFLTSGID